MFEPTMNSHLLTAILMTPLVGMLALIFVPQTAKEVIRTVAAVFTGIPLILSILLYAKFDHAAVGPQFQDLHSWVSTFNINYHLGVDGLSVPLVFLTSLLLFIAVFSSWNIQKGVKGYFILLLMLEVGINGVFLSMDFFLFYVFWEVMLLPMYFLIGIWGGPRREYAAIKFFLYTLVGSILMLVAMIGMYLYSGTAGIAGGTGERTWSLLQMAQIGLGGGWEGAPTFLGLHMKHWCFLFLFIGFAIKIPVFPFHTWLPDAHVEAPTAISVILAGVLLKLGGYGLLRVNLMVFPDVVYHDGPTSWATALALLGMINCVYGAFVAMAQTDFKKLVAYSSVAHMGFVLLGIAAANREGLAGCTLQMFNHGTSSAMLFLLVGVIYDRAHHRDLNRFGGIAGHMPMYASVAFLAIFTSLGLPGLAGFWGEAMSLLGCFKVFPVITIVSTIGLVVTAAFFLMTIRKVFFGPVKDEYKDYPDLSMREWTTLVPLGVLCVLLGWFPNLLLSWMNTSLKMVIDQITAF